MNLQCTLSSGIYSCTKCFTCAHVEMPALTIDCVGFENLNDFVDAKS